MRISDYVANYILELLEENEDESVEIKRNELANTIGCVPSQINYVITSRFTPEQGYLVESQRGGGGYIRITRMSYNKESYIMHIMHNIGGYPGCRNSKIYPSFLVTKASGAGQYFKKQWQQPYQTKLMLLYRKKNEIN